MATTTVDYSAMINSLYPGMGNKTPISLMNEVAKAHNLQADYQVTEETGPDHKKSFKVRLALGNSDTYEGVGRSIKSAQHNAAFEGLQKCGLSLPPRKNNPNPSSMTPCVELNGIAMKLGYPTQYTDLPPKAPLGVTFPNSGMGPVYQNGEMTRRGRGYGRLVHNGGYGRPYPPSIFCVSLKVGNREFYGEGRFRQEAKHKAAAKALEILREELQEKQKANEENKKLEENKVLVDTEVPTGNDSSAQSLGKSEISQVYEIATSRKLQVSFEVVKESGPPHMKNYITKVIVQEKAAETKYTSEGEGPSKKISRQRAAAKVLEELQKLPAVPEKPKLNRNPRKIRPNSNNRITAKKPKPKAELDLTLNPVSLLGQIMQQRHESLPVYTCVQDRGIQRNKDFIIKVTIDKHSAEGSGTTKKVAKRNAAEKMLCVLGIKSETADSAQAAENNSAENTTDSALDSSGSSANRKVTFNDQITGTNQDGQPTLLGRQLAPGLLPMLPEMAKASSDVVAPISQGRQVPQQKPSIHGGLNRAPGAPVGPALTLSSSLSPVQKLLNLAEVEGFQVQFTDYPKESPNNPGVQEFLTLVTISSVPPMVCHGSGASVEESREHAAENALKPLMTLGLDRGGTLRVLEEERTKGKEETKIKREDESSRKAEPSKA